MIDLAGELLHLMKNGSITATLTPRNSSSVPVNLLKSLKKKIDSAPKQCCVSGGILKALFIGSLFQTDVQSMWIFIHNNWKEHEILRRRYPALVNRKRVLLQQDIARPQTTRTIITKIQEFGEIELLPHPA